MPPAAIVVGPRPVAVIGLLLATLVTSAFGNSLQSISVLAWIQPLLLLLTYEGAVRTFRSSVVAHVCVILAPALGFTFAFAGALSYPTITFSSLLSTLGFATVISTATTLGALLPASRLRRLAAAALPPPPPLLPRGSAPAASFSRPPPLSPLGWALLALPIWAFPVLQSAIFTLLGFQLGHLVEPGVAIADWPAVAQLASLVGLWGINFLLNLTASAASCLATWEPLPLTAPAEPPGSYTEFGGGGGGSGSGFGFGAHGGASGWSRLCGPLRRQVVGVAIGGWLLVTVGGGLVYSDSFYQRPVGQRLAGQRQLPVSCLTSETLDVGSEGYVWLWQKTAERLAAGDRIVLWSEEAVAVRTPTEETALINAGRDVLQAHGSVGPDGGAYLGLCYQKLLLGTDDGGDEGDGDGNDNQQQQQQGAELLGGSGGADGTSSSDAVGQEAAAADSLESRTASASAIGTRGVVRRAAAAVSAKAKASKAVSSTEGGAGSPPPTTNHFVLLGPNGTVVWDYRKAFPVPVVEARVRPGPARLPTAASPYGTLGGAICFDMDRPQYIRQAGVAGVDLLLQPSWTWGAVGPRHYASNTLRALENGFTVFRCSSDGVSGVVTPRGVSAHYLLTGNRSALSFALPLQPRVRTAYVVVGWSLEWVNLAVAGLLLAALLLLPRDRLAGWAAGRRRGSDGGGLGDGAGEVGAGADRWRIPQGPRQQQQQQHEPLLRQGA